MPRTVKKTPRIGRLGTKIMVRRQTNEQIMQASLVKRGFVRLRLQVCVQDEHAQYLGWQGAGGVVELPNSEATLQFVALLDETLNELCKEMGLIFRRKENYARPESETAQANPGGNPR